MNKLISILSPVYNGEKYLDEMIDSLQNQTYKDWELILVNDLSTDNSVEVIQKRAATDKRIKLINRETRGGTAAKGIVYGLPYCSGDFFFYMSQDDFLESSFFEKCISKVEKTGADIVIPDVYLYYGDHMEKVGNYPINSDYDMEISGADAFYESLSWNINANLLRSMELVRKIGYSTEYYNSCELYGRKVFLEARKIVFSDAIFYYRQNNEQAITKVFRYFQIDIVTTDIILLEELIKIGYDKAKTRHRLATIKNDYFGWFKTAVAAPVNNFSERWYMIKAILSAGVKLTKLSLYMGV